MTSLVVIGILILVFLIGAIRNWGKVIGAGPTILVVGALFIIGYIGLQYSAYLDDLRAYDACVERVERSAASRKFNDTLIEIIDQEITDRPDITTRLRAAELEQLSLASCGAEPSFLTHPKDKENDQ